MNDPQNPIIKMGKLNRSLFKAINRAFLKMYSVNLNVQIKGHKTGKISRPVKWKEHISVAVKWKKARNLL